MDANNSFQVSVVIPVYNASASLRRAVESVKDAEGVIEILLVDDGSTDNSLHLSHQMEAEIPKVRVLTHREGQNRGASATRNLGLEHARGEWIQFLDSDDELLPFKLMSNKSKIEAFPQADVVIGNYLVRRKDGERKVMALKDPWHALISSQLGITSANLFRARSLRAINGWNESLSSSQEYDLMFRLMKSSSNVIYDPSFNTVVHALETSISRSPERVESNAKNRIRLRIDILSHLVKTGELTFRRKVAIHGFIFKNLGYLKDRSQIRFRPDHLLVLIYRVAQFFKTRS